MIIAQFQDVTGIDENVSRYYCELSKDRCGNWNLEDAITCFYNDLGAAQPHVWTSEKHEDDHYFDFEFFITSCDPGLYQIAIEIFTNMSLKDVLTMRGVNKTIKAFIHKERSIFTRRLKKPLLFRIENLTPHDLDEYNRWLVFLEMIEKEGSIPELFCVIPINRKYITLEPMGRPLSPFKVAVELQSIKLVKIIKSFDLLKWEEKFKVTSDDPRFYAFFKKASDWITTQPEVSDLVRPIVLKLIKGRQTHFRRRAYLRT